MRLSYYPETDSLYIDFNARAGVESAQVAEGVVIDLDHEGKVVGIEIDTPQAFST